MEGGGQGEPVAQHGHIFHLIFQEFLHQITRLHGPGAILDDGAGAVLEVQGL